MADDIEKRIKICEDKIYNLRLANSLIALGLISFLIGMSFLIRW